MPLSIYQVSVPVFLRTLTNLRNILAKGAAHAQARKIDEAAFMRARLAADKVNAPPAITYATGVAVCTYIGGALPPGRAAPPRAKWVAMWTRLV